ncbi:hypothetical protein AAVH_38758, partial [Aphelenchoides avenae]
MNGKPSSGPVCTNITADTTYCCCYGNGCNTELEDLLHPSEEPDKRSLYESIARRVEHFYDQDASSVERTFMRR